MQLVFLTRVIWPDISAIFSGPRRESFVRRNAREKYLLRLRRWLLERRKTIHDSLRAGQGELKYGAARLVRLSPQPTPMRIDDRPADRQPHPGAAGFGG